MSMSPQRVSEVTSICLRMVRGVSPERVTQIASTVARGYLRMIQESEEWKSSLGLCTINSLDPLVKSLLGKDASRVLECLTPTEQVEFGFAVASKDEENCFIWAWRSFCLFGRQFHHSNTTPKELTVL
jgi:hypothetical protein